MAPKKSARLQGHFKTECRLRKARWSLINASCIRFGALSSTGTIWDAVFGPGAPSEQAGPQGDCAKMGNLGRLSRCGLRRLPTESEGSVRACHLAPPADGLS